MKGLRFINLMLILLPALVFGETQGKGGASASSEVLSAVQVPPQVFVGDRARLVLTMVPKASVGNQSIIIDVVDKLPQSKALHISRLELDPHGKNPRIFVDFIPFEPGRITVPPVEIGPYLVSKQAVEVASVLESGATGMETAPLEEPLLVPGTRLLLYGTIFIGVLLVALVFAALFWGSAWYRLLQTWFQKRRVRQKLTQRLLRLEQDISQGHGPSPVDVGNLLSLLRTYMELVSGFPCLAKTGQELTAEAGASPFPELVLQMGSLVTFSDALRFSGRMATLAELNQLCTDCRRLILLIEQAGKRGARHETEF